MTGFPPSAGRIVVGVTGTRSLPDPHPHAAAVREVLARLAVLRGAPAVRLSVLSALAEGADRLVAHEVLRRDGGRLEAVLPLSADDYRTDFASEESRAEFDALLEAASLTTVVARHAERPVAYEAAGRYVVDHCDVVIAIWDGAPAAGRGGTAEIVDYARSAGRPLVWINATDPTDVRYERLATGGEPAG